MEDAEAPPTQPRVRKQNSLLQDEPAYRFDEKGYRVPLAAAATPPAPKAKKPPLAPKKTMEAPVPVPAAAEVVPIAARPRELAPPDGTIEEEAKKAKRTQIQWNDQRDELLMDKVIAHNALERGFMKERFQAIADELFKLEAFKNYSLVNGGTFQKRYTDMRKDAVKRWAIDEEGANLSGLAEFDSSALKGWERKLYTIILREEKSSKGKAITTVHGLNREISMLTHEKAGIQRQIKGLKFTQGNSSEVVEIEDSDFNFEEGEDEDYEEGEEFEEGEVGEDGAKRRKPKKKDQKQLGKSVQKEAKLAMSASKNSELTRSSGATSLLDPFDERLQRIVGAPKTLTPEEAALAFEEKQFELKRKQWQLDRDQEEWEVKKRRDEEEFEARREDRKAQQQTNMLLLTLLQNRENKDK